MASHFFPPTTTRMLSPSDRSLSTVLKRTRVSFSPRTFISTNFVSPCVGVCITGEFSGRKIRPVSFNSHYWTSSFSRPKRRVVARVHSRRKNASEEEAPDLESHFLKNRIIYLGSVLLPEMAELTIAEMMYLALKDNDKPMHLYINCTGTTRGDRKYGYEAGAFAILDTMRCIGFPVYTLCVGHAWGEAAFLLTAGAKGHRHALASSTIMIREPIDRYEGQASSVEINRKELQIMKRHSVEIYAKCTGKTKEQIETDIRRPKYFSASEAVEYGLIDKVLDSARRPEMVGLLTQKQSNFY